MIVMIIATVNKICNWSTTDGSILLKEVRQSYPCSTIQPNIPPHI